MANVYIYLWVQRYKIMLTLENNVGKKKISPDKHLYLAGVESS